MTFRHAKLFASAGLKIVITTWHHRVDAGVSAVTAPSPEVPAVEGGRCHGQRDTAAGGGAFRDGQRIQESRRRFLDGPVAGIGGMDIAHAECRRAAERRPLEECR